MIIKSEEWKEFKNAILDFIEVFKKEHSKISFSIDDGYDFSMSVEGCKVYPVFVRKPDYQRVEYDFTNCDIEIRTLSFSKYKDAARIEMTIKKKRFE